MSKSVLLRAPVLTASGYGVHARQIARWLFNKEEDWDLDISCELLNWGQTGWILDREACDGLVMKMFHASTNVKPVYDVTLQLQLPNEWNPSLGKFNVGITAGVETDRCNPTWIQAINSMQLVIVPSTFVKTTFENTGHVTTPIVVVPEAFIDECKKTGCSVDLDIPTSFNFLVFGQVTGNNPENDRKNLAYTIKWLAEVFHDKPDIGVILKTNVARNAKVDSVMTTNLLSKLVMEVKKGPGPKFHLLHGELSNEEVVGLYTHPKVKALLALTHGEGFGLPILEAAACGLPVIATGWSGHTDFLKHGRYLKVEHKIAPIHESRVDSHIFMSGAQWAFPQETDVKAKLTKFYDSSAVPKQWALDLQKKIIELYNFEIISKQYDSVLETHLK